MGLRKQIFVTNFISKMKFSLIILLALKYYFSTVVLTGLPGKSLPVHLPLFAAYKMTRYHPCEIWWFTKSSGFAYIIRDIHKHAFKMDLF